MEPSKTLVVPTSSNPLSVNDYFKWIDFHPKYFKWIKDIELWRFNIQNFPYLPLNFDSDIMFKLLLLHQPRGHSHQMHKMDRKYDGHMLGANWKWPIFLNDSRLGFQSNRCLGHLHCQNNSCNEFV
jgi:hypothetical protein